MPVKYNYEFFDDGFALSKSKLLLPKEEYKNSKTRSGWVCGECGDVQDPVGLSYYVKHILEGKLIVCKSCQAKKRKNAPTYEDFCEMLEKENYKMISSKEEYKNTKTLMWVETPNGHRYQARYNHFKRGHRSKKAADESFRAGIEKVRESCKSVGHELLSTVYTNKSTPLDIICGACKQKTTMTYEHLRKNKGGCGLCQDRRRSHAGTAEKWQIVVDYIDENGCTLITQRKQYTNNSSIIEYYCHCGEYFCSTWKAFLKGVRCLSCTKKKRGETNKKKYGHENVLASQYGIEKRNEFFAKLNAEEIEAIREKYRQTSIRKYGVPYKFATPEVRANALQAHIIKWGAPPGHVPEIREKQKATCRKNHGVDYPFQATKIHDKIKVSNKEKHGHEVWLQSITGRAFMKEKYDSEQFLNCEAYKAIMIELYGVEYPSQNPEILEKILRTSFSTKPFTFPSGRTENVQGYENICINYLLKKGINEENIVVGSKNVPRVKYSFEGKNRYYFPDIFIANKNRLIEVKSDYTYRKDKEKNLAKWAAASKTGYKFEVYIYNTKKNLLVFMSYTPGSDDYLAFIEDEEYEL